MVIEAVPVFDNITDWFPLWPTETFPKLTDAGDMLSTPCVPVPVIASVSGEFEALLVTIMLPVTGPADSGANWIWIVLLWPTAIDPVGLPPVTLNPAPEIVA